MNADKNLQVEYIFTSLNHIDLDKTTNRKHCNV